MFKIGVCAGHGYNTAGKRTPDGEREWTFNDKMLRAFTEQMNLYKDVQVFRYDDPTGKTDVSLASRVTKANLEKVNLYISFHHNANTAKWGTWTGTEVHVYKTCSNTSESYKLAAKLAPVIANAYGLKDRGVKKTDLYITRQTNMTAILIEGGFMDSTIDIVKLRNDTILANVGKAIADNVAGFYGLTKKAVAKPTPTTKKVDVSTHIGTVKTTCAIPLYSKPDGNGKQENFVRYLPSGSWWVFQIDSVNRMMNLGGNQWVRLADDFPQYMTYTKRIITTSCPINLYSKPNPISANYVRKLPKGDWWIFMFDTNTQMVNLGGNQWVMYNNEYVTFGA